MLAEDARSRLLEVVSTARDRLVVTWLADGGFRIGELCGLHLSDLHLREQAPCGGSAGSPRPRRHRDENPNRSRAKSKYPWDVRDGVVTGGMIKRVSPAMIHAYFDYMTTEYPRDGAGHGMLLVQLAGPDHGQPWTADAARSMLRRAGRRAGVGRVVPHQFRHSFATAVLDASGGNLLIARDAGGLGLGCHRGHCLRARRHPRPCVRGRAGEGLGRAVTAAWRCCLPVTAGGSHETGWKCSPR